MWNVTNDYTHGRIAIDDTLGAMRGVIFKVNDGLEYQTYSPEDSRRWADEVYRPQGIDFYPWGVARGWSLDIAREEGRLAGRHAAAAQRPYVLDLEPYKEDYWQGIPGTAQAFCQGYAETSTGLQLDLCPDARNPGINIEEWVAEPVVARIHPQLYATAYGEPLDLWIRKGVQPFLDLGVSRDRILPVLAGWYATAGEPSISPDDLERDILALASAGYSGFSIWRRGSISQQVVERLLAMDDPFAPAPDAPPPSVIDPTKVRMVPVGGAEVRTDVDWSDKPDERWVTVTTKQRMRLVVDP